DQASRVFDDKVASMSPKAVGCPQIHGNFKKVTRWGDVQWDRRQRAHSFVRIMGQRVIRPPGTGAKIADAPGLGKERACRDLTVIRDGYIGDKRRVIGAIGCVGWPWRRWGRSVSRQRRGCS